VKTKSGLQLGISLPQAFSQARVDPAYVRDYVRQAESLGFQDGWLTEGILNPNFTLEPITYLSYLAAITEKLRLGVAVIVLNMRNPVQLAKALASLDHLSNGRLTVGIGLGTGTRNYAAFGVAQERRVARFEEAIRVMKALWREEHVTLKGDFWRLENASMQPQPLQKPHMPLVFGGHAEPAMRRAVRMGDGWMAAGSISTEESLQDIRKMRGYLEEAGRDVSKFWLSKRLYIALDDDEKRARKRLSEALAYQYGGRNMDAVGLATTPAGAVELLGTLREAGVSHIALNPCYDHLQQMELLAAKVLPQL
jgi:probable F420-dependent oxidoreductase